MFPISCIPKNRFVGATTPPITPGPFAANQAKAIAGYSPHKLFTPILADVPTIRGRNAIDFTEADIFPDNYISGVSSLASADGSGICGTRFIYNTEELNGAANFGTTSNTAIPIAYDSGGMPYTLGSGFAIDFQGNDSASLSSATTLQMANKTIMIVFELDAIVNNSGFLLATTAGILFSGVGAIILNSGTAFATGWVPSISTKYVAHFVFDGNFSFVRANGVNVSGLGNVGAAAWAGSTKIIGRGPSAFINGRIGALIAYSGTLSSAEMAANEAAAATIWGTF